MINIAWACLPSVDLGSLLEAEKKLELELQGEIHICYETRNTIEFQGEETLCEDIKGGKKKKIRSFKDLTFSQNVTYREKNSG